MASTPLPQDYRSGFVALIGRPNVGKSTLVNQLVGEKVAITSPVAQTTRNRLRAILTTEGAQMVLVDTPGIHKPHHLLGERLVQSARSAIGEVDLVLLLLEGCERPGRGDGVQRWPPATHSSNALPCVGNALRCQQSSYRCRSSHWSRSN